MENKGTTGGNVDPKALREGRDLKMVFLHKKKPHQKKEGVCTFYQEHMQIMRHDWLTQVHLFIRLLTWSGFASMKGTIEVMFSLVMNQYPKS